MLRVSIRPRLLAILIAGAMLGACSDGGDSTAAQTGASGATGAASENTAAANSNDNDNGDGANGTPTGLAPAPWAMSAPQPASDGLRPPVIHTVD